MAETYISKVIVDLWHQAVTLEWIGANATSQARGPYRCSPGAGIPSVNCDNEATSRTAETNCTPKGDFPVLAHQTYFPKYPEAKWVTLFQSIERGIALHYYPRVPPYPNSHGCVRLADIDLAERLTHNTHDVVNHPKNPTIVSVHGELRPKLSVLRRGSSGADVRKMQRQLTERGYTLVQDGAFGPNTEAILKAFQADQNLSDIDGIFGPETYQALFSFSTQS